MEDSSAELSPPTGKTLSLRGQAENFVENLQIPLTYVEHSIHPRGQQTEIEWVCVPVGLRQLPSELLQKIAGSAVDKDELKGMRGTCPELKTAFEASVTRIFIEGSDVGTYSPLRMSERYPLLKR